jgi:predicted RNA methylase
LERTVHRVRGTYEPGVHIEMLLDEERIRWLEDAITAAVRPGDIVVDAGTGSGLLALLAVDRGAERVYAIEIDPTMAAVAKRNFDRSPHSDRITLLETDARTADLPEEVDVVAGELLHTWLVVEAQGPAFRNLRRNLRRDGRLVPATVENRLTLVNVDSFQPGLALDSPFNLRADEERPVCLSLPVTTETVDLHSTDEDPMTGEVEVGIITSGTVNGVALDSRARSHSGTWIGITPTMFATKVIPIEPREVRQGEVLSVRFTYEIGGRSNAMSFSLGSAERA